MESPLLRLLISSWSINKHGHHRQFLFLIGWFLNFQDEDYFHKIKGYIITPTCFQTQKAKIGTSLFCMWRVYFMGIWCLFFNEFLRKIYDRNYIAITIKGTKKGDFKFWCEFFIELIVLRASIDFLYLLRFLR